MRVARREPELARHDADHRVRLVVEQHLPAEDGGIAAELRLPEPVARGAACRRAPSRSSLSANSRPIERLRRRASGTGRPTRRRPRPAAARRCRAGSRLRVVHADALERRCSPPSSRGKFAGESSSPPYPGVRSQSLTSRSGSGNGSGRSRTKSVTENAAVVAPMPSATISTAVIANPGARRSTRPVYDRSCRGCRGGRRRRCRATSPIVRQPERATPERPSPGARRRANSGRISSPYSFRNDAGYRRSRRSYTRMRASSVTRPAMPWSDRSRSARSVGASAANSTVISNVRAIALASVRRIRRSDTRPAALPCCVRPRTRAAIAGHHPGDGQEQTARQRPSTGCRCDCAPSAMRTPISCMRCDTANDSRPWMPIAASRKATTANPASTRTWTERDAVSGSTMSVSVCISVIGSWIRAADDVANDRRERRSRHGRPNASAFGE